MNVMVDFLMCILAAVVIFMIVGKNTIVTAARFLAAALAVGVAVLVVQFGAKPLSEALPNPLVNGALEEMADISGLDTAGWDASSYASLIDYDALKDTELFAKLLAEYGVTAEEVAAAAAASDGEAAAAAAACMAAPLWQVVVSLGLRLVVTVLAYVLFLALIRAVLYRKFHNVRRKKLALLTGFFAILAMLVVMSYFVVPVMESFRP
ncbi:MAG: hypothetical protein IJY28_01340, partial [Clostridia bacterium]|nr:hypothetical protein [Clostridia bacterium]